MGPSSWSHQAAGQQHCLTRRSRARRAYEGRRSELEAGTRPTGGLPEDLLGGVIDVDYELDGAPSVTANKRVVGGWDTDRLQIVLVCAMRHGR